MDIYTDVIHLEPSDVESKGGKLKIKGMNGNGLIVVYAPWCHHCQSLKPTWMKLANSDQMKFLAVNSTDSRGGKELGNMLGANGFPSIFIVKGGEVAGKYSGNRSLDDLRNSAQ